jgi:hypothetical protein
MFSTVQPIQQERITGDHFLHYGDTRVKTVTSAWKIHEKIQKHRLSHQPTRETLLRHFEVDEGESQVFILTICLEKNGEKMVPE